jgi:hypothetical protein
MNAVGQGAVNKVRVKILLKRPIIGSVLLLFIHIASSCKLWQKVHTSPSRARDARACGWQASGMMDSHLLVVSGVK